MQLQADLAGAAVEVSANVEATALGAAALAGLAIGVWPNVEASAALRPRGTLYEPSLSPERASRTASRLASKRSAVTLTTP